MRISDWSSDVCSSDLRGDRRHGRAAEGDRHRRAAGQDAAGGARLPPPLRRGLVDGGALQRLSAEGASGFRAAAVVGEVPDDDYLPRLWACRRAERSLVSLDRKSVLSAKRGSVRLAL